LCGGEDETKRTKFQLKDKIYALNLRTVNSQPLLGFNWYRFQRDDAGKHDPRKKKSENKGLDCQCPTRFGKFWALATQTVQDTLEKTAQ
jgi:hypothetical protein